MNTAPDYPNFPAFADAYRSGLKRAMENYPDQYMKGLSSDAVADKMLDAISTRGLGTVSVTRSHGFRYACKSLGIKPTYREIEAFLKRPGPL